MATKAGRKSKKGAVKRAARQRTSKGSVKRAAPHGSSARTAVERRKTRGGHARAAGKPAAHPSQAPLARRSPGKLRLTMMTGDYEIVRALKDGTVQPKGIELVTGHYPGTRNIHHEVASGQGCDINEYNGGHYVVQKAHGRKDITAIPVFLHRRFRHGFIYINTGRGITRPSDLAGRRIACRTIGAAANYWMRGHLEELGVPHRSVTWVIETLDEASERAPKDLKIEVVPAGKKVEDMVAEGEVDAIIQPNVNLRQAEGDPRVAHLWPNYREVEREYFQRTGFFPIMHVTTVPADIVAKHPWVVESLTLAFEEAKQLACQRLVNPRNVPLAWFRSYWVDEHKLLGADPWEYGMSEINRNNYDTLAGYVHDQVLTGPRPRLEDLFAKESFELESPLPQMHPIHYDF